ncbi:hypothetical protein ILUMI_25588, partial [Ignelater luminosus]
MRTFNKSLFILTIFCLAIANNAYMMRHLIGSEIQECLNCLCHARSGCWNRLNCANYSITKTYWEKSGSPTNGNYLNSDESFKFCMQDENCILNAVKGYTESFGEK